MKIEAKINEFTKVAESEAEKKRALILEELEKEMNASIEIKTKELEDLSSKTIKEEKIKIDQEFNKEVIQKVSTYKKDLMSLRNRYEAELFSDVKSDLDKFIASNEYVNFLVKEIRGSLDGSNNFKLYLTKRDISHKEDITKEFKDVNLEILPSDEDFIGGFKIVIVDKNILMDNSFKTRLQEEKEKFNGFRIS